MPKCGFCKTPTTNKIGLKTLCSIDCAIDYGRQQKEKRERREIREAQRRIKTRRQWLKEVQAIFNKWVRLRDSDLPCISCGRWHAGSYDAGHYRSIAAAPSLRFHPLNCWKQCVPCNQHKSGNAIEYRINLVKRIGEDRVRELESANEPRKYTIDELIGLKMEFTRKVRELEKERL